MQLIPSIISIAIQDTPAIKFTYTAAVTSPLPILMSALGVSPSREEMSAYTIDASVAKVYSYTQSVPIPSYLLAVCGGEVAFASLGERTGVWAEPSMLEAARWEFEETEKFIGIAESISSPYSWGRYGETPALASCAEADAASIDQTCSSCLPPSPTEEWRTPI